MVEKLQVRDKESHRANIMFSLRDFLGIELQELKIWNHMVESMTKINKVAAMTYIN